MNEGEPRSNPGEFDPRILGGDIDPLSKKWTEGELTQIAGGQYENLVYWMVPARFRHLALSRHVRVEMVDEREKLYGSPAAVEINRGDRLTVLFDRETYDDLAEKFAGIYNVSEDEVAELYVGTGIARHIFWRRVKNIAPEKVESLANILSAPLVTETKAEEGIADAVRRADLDFTREEILELLESITYMDEEQRTQINALRFATGLLFGKQAELTPTIPEDLLRPESNITALCRDGIKAQLAKKRSYIKLFRSLNLNSAEAQYRFSEGFSELEVATAFPMESTEIQVILNLCK